MRTYLTVTLFSTMILVTGCTAHNEKQTSITEPTKTNNVSAPEIQETQIKPENPDSTNNAQSQTLTKPVKVERGSILDAINFDCLLGIVLIEECEINKSIKITKNH